MATLELAAEAASTPRECAVHDWPPGPLTSGPTTVDLSGTDAAYCISLVEAVTGADSCAICGDGAVDAGEQCDDGNLTPGDGCAADCTME